MKMVLFHTSLNTGFLSAKILNSEFLSTSITKKPQKLYRIPILVIPKMKTILLFHSLGIPVAYTWETFQCLRICYMVSKRKMFILSQLGLRQICNFFFAINIINFLALFYFPITSIYITIYCSFWPKKDLNEYIFFICIFPLVSSSTIHWGQK